MTEIPTHALLITGFVTVMMVVVEYLNVLSSGQWQRRLSQQRWGQHLYAALLGAIPGCLGAFAITTMYSRHRYSGSTSDHHDRNYGRCVFCHTYRGTSTSPAHLCHLTVG